MAALVQPKAEFRGRGGFAGAVHADDEDHERLPIGARRGWRRIFRQSFGNVAASGFHHVICRNFAAEVAEFVDDRGAHADAEIGADEVGLEVVPIDFRAIGDLVK